MPKIIENLEARLIAEAQKQIMESGYNAMTVRSLAKACDVGVGTVYNYFPSKEHLLTDILLRDWEECLTAIEGVSLEASAAQPVLRCIYDQLHAFTQHYQYLFHDEAALAAVAACFSRFHTMIRAQLAEPIRKYVESEFDAEFIIEGLMTWTSEKKPFEEIYRMISKLL